MTREDGGSPPATGAGWLSTAEAAERLGVRRETVYAYVSRGILHPRRDADGRRSRFARDEVEALAARARKGGRAGGLEVLVETRLTLVEPAGHLSYRGRDAVELATTGPFERVAEWLWRGGDDPGPWTPTVEALSVGRAAQAGLPTRASLAERLRVAVPAIAATDVLRADLRPTAVVATARGLLAALPACLSPAGPAAPGEGASTAGRALAALGEPEPDPAATALVDAALGLLADHDLAASTLAARVAASTHADPYLVVLAGLGTLGGPLHGAASRRVEELLRGLEEPARAVQRVGEHLARGEEVPGFGHAVYTGVDPRARALLGLLRHVRGQDPTVAATDAVIAAVARHDGPAPNVDLALGAVTTVLGLPVGAGELLFTLARIAGWVAHALEEYPHRLRYRPRALYTGPRPGGDDRAP